MFQKLYEINQKIILTGLILAIFCAQVFALPPLVSVDWSSPRYRDMPPEDHAIYGVNLVTKSLDGYSISSGVAELAYDESFGASANELGNFAIEEIVFAAGVGAAYPKLYNVPGVGTVLKVGVRQYPLTFVSSSTISGGTREAYSLTKHGRYILLIDTFSTHTDFTVHDTATSIIYTFETDTNGTMWKRPARAELPDGYLVKFLYNTTGLQSAILEHGQIVEIMTFAYDADYHLEYITTNKDSARNIRFIYNADGTLKEIDRGVLPPSDLTPVSGLSLEYLTTGSGALIKKALVAVKSLQNVEIIRFFTTTIGTAPNDRTAYNGVRVIPNIPSATQPDPIWIDYSQPNNEIKITTPTSPNNPIFFTLHPTRGLPIKKRDSICPDPLEELIFLPVGDPNAGQVDEERIRPRCDKLVVKKHVYQNGALSEVQVSAGGEIATTKFTQAWGGRANGAREMQVSRITDPKDNYTDYNRDSYGRLWSVTLNSGDTVIGHNYEFWDAEQKRIKKVTTYAPSGREDYVEYDSTGRIISAVYAANSANATSSQIVYDSTTGRLKQSIDPRGNWTHITYKSAKDNRVDNIKMTLQAEAGAEVARTTYTYNTTYPDLPEQETNTVTENGNSATSQKHYQYHPTSPVLTKITVNNAGQTQATLMRTAYDPKTMLPTKQCGYSKDGTDQSCTDFVYKTSGNLKGLLDKVVVAGGIPNMGYEVTPLYSTEGDVYGQTSSDAAQSITQQMTFDNFARLDTVTLNPSASGAEKVETHYDYDSAGKVITSTKKIAGVTVSDKTINYDNLGKSPRVLSTSDAVTGVAEVFEYNDWAKRLTLAKTILPGNTIASKLEINSEDYDQSDRALRISTTSDGQGKSTQTFAYNAFGDLVSSVDARDNLTQYQYDQLGRLKFWQDSLKQSTITYSVLNGKTVINEMTEDQINPQTWPAGTIHSYRTNLSTTKDALGNLVETYDDLFKIRKIYTQDNQGRLAQVLTSYENSSLPAVSNVATDFFYDSLGRMQEVKENNVSLWYNQYTGLGNLNSSRDSRSVTTTYQYDRLGRLIRTNYPDTSKDEITDITYYPGNVDPLYQVTAQKRGGDTEVSKFNRLGQLMETNTSGPGRSPLRETYDYQNSRLLKKTSIINPNSPTNRSEITFGYDTYGRANLEQRSITDSTQGRTFDLELGRTYDEQGYLIGHRYGGSQSTAEIGYNRDNFGRIRSITRNGVEIALYEYVGQYKVFERVAAQASGVDRYFGYKNNFPLLGTIIDFTLDGYNGNTSTVSPGQISLANYYYDAKYRLSSRIREVGRQNGTPSDITENFTYTNLDMLNNYSSSRTWGSYPFNPVNITFNVQTDGSLANVGGTPDSMFQLPSAFTYDGRGNPLSAVNGPSSYVWNFQGLQSQENIRFGQDAFGRYTWWRNNFEPYRVYLREDGMVLGYIETN